MQKIKISVIIPARNEEKYIESCIKSVKVQDFDCYEIIVVDNGSTDRTAKIAQKLGVKVVFESRVGLPRAKETGRGIAKGNLLVYIDADTILPHTYLSTLFKFFESHKKVTVASNPFLFYDGNYALGVSIKIFFKFVFPLYHKILQILHLPKMIFGSNFAVRKEILDKVGGFDTSIKFYGEDTNIAKKLSQKGEVAYISNLYTYTSARRYNKEGFFRTIFIYFANYIYMLWFNRPISIINSFSSGLTFWSNPLPILRYGIITICVTTLFMYGLAYPKSEVFGKVIYRISSKDKEVALTFDDGPNGKYTEQILDLLDKENIKATFFLIGKNVEVYPNIAKEIVKRGHCIGNHSYAHSWELPFTSKKKILDDLNKAKQVIYNATGIKTDLFRPPHCLRTPWMIEEIHQQGYKMITWNDMTTNYILKTKAEKIAKKIISETKPGSIIVLHDGLNTEHNVNRENTVEALKIIIKNLKEKGYAFTLINTRA